MFTAFTAPKPAPQQISAGTVSLDLGTGAGNRFSVVADGMVPGGTIERRVTLTNGGSEDLASLTLTTTATTSSLLDTDAVRSAANEDWNRQLEQARVRSSAGALLRRKGLYTSHIVEWRKARDAGAREDLAPKPKAKCLARALRNPSFSGTSPRRRSSVGWALPTP